MQDSESATPCAIEQSYRSIDRSSSQRRGTSNVSTEAQDASYPLCAALLAKQSVRIERSLCKLRRWAMQPPIHALFFGLAVWSYSPLIVLLTLMGTNLDAGDLIITTTAHHAMRAFFHQVKVNTLPGSPDCMPLQVLSHKLCISLKPAIMLVDQLNSSLPASVLCYCCILAFSFLLQALSNHARRENSTDQRKAAPNGIRQGVISAVCLVSFSFLHAVLVDTPFAPTFALDLFALALRRLSFGLLRYWQQSSSRIRGIVNRIFGCDWSRLSEALSLLAVISFLWLVISMEGLVYEGIARNAFDYLQTHPSILAKVADCSRLNHAHPIS